MNVMFSMLIPSEIAESAPAPAMFLSRVLSRPSTESANIQASKTICGA